MMGDETWTEIWANVEACRKDCGHFALSSVTPGDARDVDWLCEVIDKVKAAHEVTIADYHRALALIADLEAKLPAAGGGERT